MNTMPIEKFLGINNRLPSFALATANGYWLREAENVDLDNSGHVRRRDGVTLVQAMSGAHSVFSLSSTAGLLVRSGTLYSFTTAYAETLLKLLSTNDQVHYARYNGNTYFSNGTDSGKIVAGVWYPWALPTPDAPAVSSATGTLKVGSYQVAVRYLNSVTGEAGGLSASSVRSVAIVGGIRVTPPASVPGATHVQIFVSQLNGSQVYLHSTVAAGVSTADISTLSGLTTTGEGEYVAPMPACRNLFLFKGKLCGTLGKRLYYGISYRPGYYAPDDGYIDFEDEISVAIANQNGVYVATEKKTYWIAGDLKNAEELRELLPYGAIFGTAFAVQHKKLVGWFGKNGFVIGDEQGQLSAVTQDAVDVTPSGANCAEVYEADGCRRVVSNGYAMNLETTAMSTYSDFAFTSLSGMFGTTPSGLYLMTGDQAIDAHIDLGELSFGGENLKALPACYLGAASKTPMELRVKTSDDDEYRYFARSSSDNLRIHRVDPGKGLRENWYGLSIHNTEGSDFTLASVSFAPVESGRRIKT